MSLQRKVTIVTGGKKDITQSNFGGIDLLTNNASGGDLEDQVLTKLKFQEWNWYYFNKYY